MPVTTMRRSLWRFFSFFVFLLHFFVRKQGVLLPYYPKKNIYSMRSRLCRIDRNGMSSRCLWNEPRKNVQICTRTRNPRTCAVNFCRVLCRRKTRSTCTRPEPVQLRREIAPCWVYVVNPPSIFTLCTTECTPTNGVLKTSTETTKQTVDTEAELGGNDREWSLCVKFYRV